MLAEALDAEELDDYRFVALTHGKDAIKKWKWQTPDHAGTKSIETGENVYKSLTDFARAISGGGPLRKTGTVGEYASVRGLRKVYRQTDGTLTDEGGNAIDIGSRVFVASEE